MMKPTHVLVVDDDRHIRMTLKQVLEDAGYRVTTAENGSVALDHAFDDASACDLVLLDVRMPGMSGLEVLEEIGEKRPELPVVIVSAHGTVDQAVEAIQAGAETFIHKPFSPDQIRSAVAQALATEETSDADYDAHVEAARDGIRNGDLEQAHQHIREAFAVDATRPEAFNLLGVTMQLRNKYQEAQRYYQSALALQPGYEPAMYNRDNISRSPQRRDASDYRLE